MLRRGKYHTKHGRETCGEVLTLSRLSQPDSKPTQSALVNKWVGTLALLEEGTFDIRLVYCYTRSDGSFCETGVAGRLGHRQSIFTSAAGGTLLLY